VVVAALTLEPATERVLAWLERQTPGELAISFWSITEVSSALSLKLRTRQLEAAERAAASVEFSRLVAESLTILQVSPEHFRAAARFAGEHQLGVRAGDALHMAVCLDHGLRLHTLDRRMVEAGPVLGVDVAAI
jgi:uncharacterized protein